MKNREEAYIGLELKTHHYPDDLGESGMNDILDDGIDITADELYQFIYLNGYHCEEEHLKMMLDEHDNSNNMLYPLECNYDKTTSYEDWIEYKEAMEEEEKLREKQNKENQ